MKRGFSLIELLVVITIIAILVGVAAPYYSDYVRESKISKAKADLDVLRQAVILYNSREDTPYQGPLASTSPFIPLLGENDFVGLQGQYLTNIPLDPWSKNYKLDPYGCFVYSEGPDSRSEKDDIREYYVKELALRKIEWEDSNNNRALDVDDLIYLHFNKSVLVLGNAVSPTHFDVYENNQVVSTLTFNIISEPTLEPGYTDDTATHTTIICRVTSTLNMPKVGVHSIALKDDVAILQNYKEVIVDRERLNRNIVYVKWERSSTDPNRPLRYAVRTAPVKITPKN